MAEAARQGGIASLPDSLLAPYLREPVNSERGNLALCTERDGTP